MIACIYRFSTHSNGLSLQNRCYESREFNCIDQIYEITVTSHMKKFIISDNYLLIYGLYQIHVSLINNFLMQEFRRVNAIYFSVVFLECHSLEHCNAYGQDGKERKWYNKIKSSRKKATYSVTVSDRLYLCMSKGYNKRLLW